uniref:Transmembrane ascorbate-dependent reductase CYB561 n=1 Tax=Takifugu rubripes TaxID=31033 RepID=A0A3B5KCG0_TAKRU
MEDSAPRRGRVTFGWLVGLSQVLGLVSVVLAGVWMGQYKGGFAWDGSAQQFNVHPLCMVLGLVFLQGDAILVYRVFHNEAKRNIKILHGIIHLLALGISIIGFVAVFNFHKVAKIPDMYSLHSWVGMATIVLFFLQVHTHTHTHTHMLPCCDSNSNQLLFFLVGNRLAVLPVSCCVVMVTSLISPHPCVLWTGSAGHVHWVLPAGHHRETPLQPAHILSVHPRGGAGQRPGSPPCVFWGGRVLHGHQGGLQTSSQPRGGVSVCLLQDAD